jgi:hypothetical protein
VAKSNNAQDRLVQVFDSSHVFRIDPDTGNIEIYKRRLVTDGATAHREGLKEINRRNAEHWRNRNDEAHRS